MWSINSQPSLFATNTPATSKCDSQLPAFWPPSYRTATAHSLKFFPSLKGVLAIDDFLVWFPCHSLSLCLAFFPSVLSLHSFHRYQLPSRAGVRQVLLRELYVYRAKGMHSVYGIHFAYIYSIYCVEDICIFGRSTVELA